MRDNNDAKQVTSRYYLPPLAMGEQEALFSFHFTGV